MTSSRKILVAILVVAAVGAIAGWKYWQSQSTALPAGFVSSNGRLEAKEVDIATKFAGRVASVLAEEGDQVKKGQLLARMDIADLEADKHKALAEVRQARKAEAAAVATVAQRRSACEFAASELKRALFLVQKGHVSNERLEQRTTEKEQADAACSAAEARLGDAREAIAVDRAQVARIEADIAESELRSPRAGRVQYRLAEPGEVLAAGGKILTIIALDDLYMTLFLPATEAARVRIGAEARIVLDGIAGHPVPAKVTFVAAQAQFTPKEVETKDERQKLVFRIKTTALDGSDPTLKPGMPGVGFIRIDPAAAWPERLQ